MKKIIFLDIDGVLNNQNYADTLHFLFKGNGYGGHESVHLKRDNIKWDLYNVASLKKLMQLSKAKIVISSSWRHFHDINNFKFMFQLYGLQPGKIIDVTPDQRNTILTIRGDAINKWLALNPIDKYVILDDCADFHKGQHLVQTDPDLGLTDKDVEDAMVFLA